MGWSERRRTALAPRLVRQALVKEGGLCMDHGSIPIPGIPVLVSGWHGAYGQDCACDLLL